MQEMELYGYKTSNKATKLIIDLFNKINSGKPYKMKTITTIYQNDDIFKDNQRYPIDAPFREFYKELTEEYVPYHKLDNIFITDIENSELGGFYFEYTYNKKNNQFTIYKFPKNLGEEISKSYVPMLYSMLTSEKIDWESARQKIIFSKKANKNPSTVLLVFKKCKLKTLEFSWLASFEISNTSKMSINNIIKEVMQQEDEIVNSTQGVLFTELDDIILEYDRIRELVKNHKHTIKNFGFESHLMKLYMALETNEILEAKKVFDYIENLALLRDITTNVIYDFDGKITDLLLYKRGFTSYSSILTLLFRTSVSQATNTLSINKIAEESGLNRIQEGQLLDVFTVLLNVYSNVCSKSKFSINFDFTTDNNLMITFCNSGSIERKYQDYLNGKTYINPSKGEGLRFIVHSLNRLPHMRICCEVKNDETITTLLIKQVL